MDGVLVVDKPAQITSHDVVTRARRALGTRRIGHLGTLDPMATGVLPLVIGRATRLVPLLSGDPKVYAAVIRLGVETDTYDITGTVMAGDRSAAAARIPDRDTVINAVQTFTGTLLQRPPPYSAKKVGGVRAYRLARQQRAVNLQPVEVTVRDVAIITLDGDRLSCRITCSPGFYMRSLAHDLGQLLGCGGCLESLRRERSGAFDLSAAVTLDRLEAEGHAADVPIMPLGEMLPELRSVVTTERGALRAAHGNPLGPADMTRPPSPAPDDRHHWVKIFDDGGRLLAVAQPRPGGLLHPKIVLV